MLSAVVGVVVLGLTLAVIMKVADAFQDLPWFERRRLQKAFDAANNWKPSTPPERTPTLYADGSSAWKALTPIEIAEWAARPDHSHPIVRIVDPKGIVVWKAGPSPGSTRSEMS
jgi:hypothetical protein